MPAKKKSLEEPAEETLAVEKKDEKAPPITADQFSAALAELVTLARAAGLRPVQMMLSTYVKQGMSVIDGLLGALEGSSQKKKDE